MGLMSAITGNATEVSESKIQETIGPLFNFDLGDKK